ncbi:sensor histidine kinase [Candidatus Leptofilum sp.]|uniref:sensor histidine kinase n=1 Tax=Candidatus Leptofilum sp. TaxID=3241576 RepID=UPI003B5AE0E8
MILAKPKQWDSYYLTIVSVAGLSIVFFGLIQFPLYEQPLNLLLLILLAAVAEIAATFMTVGDEQIAFEVGTAIGLGAVPFYGPLAASIVVTSSGLAFWLYKNKNKPASERSWTQLTFNIGMHSIAILIAGNIFLAIEGINNLSIFRSSLAWLCAAVAYDQINFWLLVIMLRMIHGAKFQPKSFWLENRWAMVVNLSVLIIGGVLLASAISRFQSIGIIIFFFPILLSSLSFRLYVRKIQTYMENLEGMVAERTQELSEVMREKDAFLAVLTHDMKTPLTTIGLYAEMLIKWPDIATKKPHISQIIRNNQQALTEIVNNILDLENLQVGGTLKLEFEPFNLINSLQYLLESISVQAEKKEITLGHHFGAASIMLSGDEEQLKRVFQNLLSNAIKYTPEGGQVCLEAAVDEKQVMVHVRDTGYGIPTEEIPYIFDRFRRVEKHEKKAVGTGLGLAIVKAIVEAHDGQITVTSEEEKGSQFTVTLPL